MKRSLVFLCCFLFIITVSCDKSKHRMTVVKDCTGVYLRQKSGQDFKVCNDHLLDDIADGEKISVSYENLEECFGIIESAACFLEHIYEGKIEITEIH